MAELEANFSLENNQNIDALFEIYAAGTTWGNISGNMENQTDLKNVLDTMSGQIDSNHGAITEIALTMQGYGNIVTYSASDFATAAQGTLASTALQPGDYVSQLVNDAGYITTASLPTVNNSKITIQKNSTDVASFTLNQASGQTINIAVPTKVSELSNDSGFITGITSGDVTTALGFTPYDSSNPAGYITSADLPTNYVTTNTAQTISAQKNWSGKLNILNNSAITGGVDAYTTYALLQRNNTSREVIFSNGGDKLRLRGSETRPQYNTNDLALYSDVTSGDSALQAEIDVLKARGRFLALWDCSTGLAESNPPTSPYTYQSGDYFIVGTVSTATPPVNYKPTGSSYTTGVASTVVETETVDVDDVYYYDGTNWRLQVNTQKTVSFVNIAGDPYDNTNLATALNSKADTSSLATVATTGEYSDLLNTPTIPTDTSDLTNGAGFITSASLPIVNNATLTIQKNGTTVDTFTANSSSDVTVNITVPIDNSELSNGAGYITGITSGDVTTALGFTPVNKAGDTMSGTLTVEGNINAKDRLQLVMPNMKKGTNPSDTQYQSILFNDKTNSSTWTATRLGCIEFAALSTGDTMMSVGCYRNTSNSSTQAGFGCGWDRYGNGYTHAMTPAANSDSTDVATTEWVNDKGYITGITSGDVTTALGYTPVNKTGDAMTGGLSIGNELLTNPFTLRKTNNYSTQTTSGNTYQDIVFQDYTNIRRNSIRSQFEWDSSGQITRSVITLGTNNIDGSAPQGIQIQGSQTTVDGVTTNVNYAVLSGNMTIPATSNKNNMNIATCGWVNDNTRATNVVHRDSTETISGSKVFTANLQVRREDTGYQYRNQLIDFTTTPVSSITKTPFEILDKEGRTMSRINYSQSTDGSHKLIIQDKKNNSESDWASIEVGWDSNANAYTLVPNPDASSNGRNIATTSWVKDFAATSGSNYMSTFSQGANGYYKFTNGLIIQWGSTLSNSGVRETITLPTAYTSTNYKVVTQNQGGGHQQATVDNYTTTTFRLDPAATTTYDWIAIGY